MCVYIELPIYTYVYDICMYYIYQYICSVYICVYYIYIYMCNIYMYYIYKYICITDIYVSHAYMFIYAYKCIHIYIPLDIPMCTHTQALRWVGIVANTGQADGSWMHSGWNNVCVLSYAYVCIDLSVELIHMHMQIGTYTCQFRWEMKHKAAAPGLAQLCKPICVHPSWSKETPPPGRVSYLLYSLIKNRV